MEATVMDDIQPWQKNALREMMHSSQNSVRTIQSLTPHISVHMPVGTPKDLRQSLDLKRKKKQGVKSV